MRIALLPLLGGSVLTALLLGNSTPAYAADPVYPGRTWEEKTPAAAGLDRAKLDAMAALSGGRGCVVRRGCLVFTWGDGRRSGDIASACKPLYSHLLFQAITDGKLAGVDELVMSWQPCLSNLNAKLGYKDRKMTFRHLANQTACLGFTEDPGTAFDYNDATMGFFWDTLVNKVYGLDWASANQQLFAPKLTRILQFQDEFSFPVRGRTAGRPRISPRDFARFGLLYLHQGRWREHRLIRPEQAIMAVSDPLSLDIPRTAAQPAEACATRSIGGGANQTDHNGGYSWLWWLNRVARDGRLWFPDAPADMFMALGHCGQRGLAVMPTQQLIVSWNDTRELHCDRELGNRFFKLLRDSVTDSP